MSLIALSCQKASNVVIDTSQPIDVQLTYFDKDSLDVASYLGSNSSPATVSDSFQVTLNSSSGFKYLEVQVSNDSGAILNDVTYPQAGGSVVSGKITTVVQNVYVGDLAYTFTAYNNNGAAGNFDVKNLRLFNSRAQAPVIDSVSAPDSLKVGSTDTVKVVLTAYVTDPSGPGNISKAYFNVTKPDGNPSTGNPWLMYDDGGASGALGDVDPVPNDGHYTLGISLPPGTATGTYVFTFYAVNRSGLVSNPLAHKIKVY